MSNLSYCRFENTYKDLKDCLPHITDDLDSKSEHDFRYKLINLCQEIINLYYDDELMAFDDEPFEDEQ